MTDRVIFNKNFKLIKKKKIKTGSADAGPVKNHGIKSYLN